MAQLHFGELNIETRGDHHVFEVQVYTAELDPSSVKVELYADALNGGVPVRQEMKRVRQLAAVERVTSTPRKVPSARPRADYTARVIPFFSGVAVPLESPQVLWQR